MKDFNRAQEALVKIADKRILTSGRAQTTSRAGKTSDGSVGDITRRLDELRAIRANLGSDFEVQAILKACNIMDSDGRMSNDDWNQIVELSSSVPIQQERENDTYSANMQQPRVGAMSSKTLSTSNKGQGSSSRTPKPSEPNSKAPLRFIHPGENDPNQISVPKRKSNGEILSGSEFKSIEEVSDTDLENFKQRYSKNTRPTLLDRERYEKVITVQEERRKREDKDKPCVIS